MNAYIFNIQKFSIHDGPGIRTTVFFKGCNLRCRWCANPESQRLKPQLTLDRGKCMLCLRCSDACARKARKAVERGVYVDTDKCTLCGTCALICPAQAIGMEGSCMRMEDVLSELLKDKPFYDHSGGGVTFSGGEVLVQQEFAVELARALHENGVHVAVETAAAVPKERFSAFLKEIDYVFVDLKHYDSARHREGTGQGNERILENIRALAASGIEYMIRIPVIPGFNDALEDARGFASLLREMGIYRAQLLPFHQLGERKYALLGMDYDFAGQKQLRREDLEQYRRIFEKNGIDAQMQGG